MVKLATWNINGIRSCYLKGLEHYLSSTRPDVLMLQEVKASPEQCLEVLNNLNNEYTIYVHSAQRKGYSGVLTLVKKSSSVLSYVDQLGVEEFDQEGRFHQIETPNFYLINTYIPNGGREHDRVPYKLAFSTYLRDWMQELYQQSGKPIIIGGDFNTAHTEIDLTNPKTNQKTSGFLPIERAWMTEFIEFGNRDIYRYLNPSQKDAYTWWSYRQNCRARNIGWRIDYFFDLGLDDDLIVNCQMRPEILGSDHCPVELELKGPL